MCDNSSACPENVTLRGLEIRGICKHRGDKDRERVLVGIYNLPLSCFKMKTLKPIGIYRKVVGIKGI